MIKVLADQNLYKLHRFLPRQAQMRRFDPSVGLPENWPQYDALLIRTVTSISRSLFEDRTADRLSFIGSGSAGFDHVDTELLKDKGIRFSHAPGCNARAVAEYTITALFVWSEYHEVDLRDMQIGVVGVGHVGTALIRLLDRLSLNYAAYDPPREEREEDFTSADLGHCLDSDILTFHTPLSRGGPHATHHWLDRELLERTSFKLVINAARGGVVDENALLAFYKKGNPQAFILDVWEGEPQFKDESARRAFIRTPHIAGYSAQAKLRASRMISDALARHFELPQPPPLREDYVDHSAEFEAHTAHSTGAVLKKLHPLPIYQNDLDQLIGLPDEKKGLRFNQIRTNRSYRYEFPHLLIPDAVLSRHPVLRKLGLQSGK